MVSLATRWMRIDAQRAPSSSPTWATFVSRAIILSSFRRTALKETLVDPIEDLAGGARRSPAVSTGLICTRMVSCDTHSRTSGVIVGLPA